MTTKIYALCESGGGEIRYIGKTKFSLRRRFSGHLKDARRGRKSYNCNWIRSVMRKGLFPTIIFIGEVEGTGAAEERAWIAYGREMGWRLTNTTDGGEGAYGLKMSEKNKLTLALSMKGNQFAKGYHHTDETKKIVGAKSLGNKHALGNILLETTRKRMSLSKLGKKFSAEHKNKIRLANLGRTHSDIAKLNMSTAQKKRYLKQPVSAETREKLRLVSLGLKRSPETLQRMSIAQKKRFQHA